MQRNFPGSLVVLVAVLQACEAADDPDKAVNTTPACFDSDGGREYTVKGSVDGTTISWTDDDRRSFDDWCIDFSIGQFGQAVVECDGADCAIDEYFCQDGIIMYEYVKCEHGCRDGACLPGPVCTDTDGGQDYGVKGFVHGTTISWTDDDRRDFDDVCVDFGIPQYGAVVDECEGDLCSIFEVFCKDGVIMYEYVSCEHGCRDGACLPGPVCTDTDGGQDYGVRGFVHGTAISWQDDDRRDFDDVCVDFGIPQYGAVVDECEGDLCSISEMFCKDGVIVYEYVHCENGCKKGACIEPATSP